MKQNFYAVCFQKLINSAQITKFIKKNNYICRENPERKYKQIDFKNTT